MAPERRSKTDVVKATETDLAEILRWLENEYVEDGEGFWVNRAVINRSFERGELWAVRSKGNAVAFQVGEYSPDIFCVKKEWRGQGLGRALHDALVDRALSTGRLVLFGECAPRTSLSYWKKLGYERYGREAATGPINVRLVLPIMPVQLPDDCPRTEVSITFYPECASHVPETTPLSAYKLIGARDERGVITLEHIAIGLSDGEADHDLVVKIEVDAEQLYFGKAKYKEAQDLGVEMDRDGVFYLEWLLPHTRSA